MMFWRPLFTRHNTSSGARSLVLLALCGLILAGAHPAFSDAPRQDAPPNGTVDSLVLVYSTDHSEYYHLTYWSDGLRINAFIGWLLGGGRIPAIIYNRGGAWNNGKLIGLEIVPFVEAGYVAAASQYRGNAGSEGSEQFGWGEVNDVLALVPLLQALPNVDPARIGMMGGSRGGMVTYMALKAETMHGTHDIQAAVAVGGIADLFMWAEERPDVVEAIYLPLIGARPADNFDAFEMRSATYWPELINTPLLLLHGEADDQVAVEQSLKLYRLLKRAGKTVKLVTYPGDDHPLSGQLGGYPEALRWFDRYFGDPGVDRAYDSHWDNIHAASAWFAEHPQ